MSWLQKLAGKKRTMEPEISGTSRKSHKQGSTKKSAKAKSVKSYVGNTHEDRQRQDDWLENEMKKRKAMEERMKKWENGCSQNNSNSTEEATSQGQLTSPGLPNLSSMQFPPIPPIHQSLQLSSDLSHPSNHPLQTSHPAITPFSPGPLPMPNQLISPDVPHMSNTPDPLMPNQLISPTVTNMPISSTMPTMPNQLVPPSVLNMPIPPTPQSPSNLADQLVQPTVPNMPNSPDPLTMPSQFISTTPPNMPISPSMPIMQNQLISPTPSNMLIQLGPQSPQNISNQLIPSAVLNMPISPDLLTMPNQFISLTPSNMPNSPGPLTMPNQLIPTTPPNVPISQNQLIPPTLLNMPIAPSPQGPPNIPNQLLPSSVMPSQLTPPNVPTPPTMPTRPRQRYPPSLPALRSMPIPPTLRFSPSSSTQPTAPGHVLEILAPVAIEAMRTLPDLEITVNAPNRTIRVTPRRLMQMVHQNHGGTLDSDMRYPGMRSEMAGSPVTFDHSEHSLFRPIRLLQQELVT